MIAISSPRRRHIPSPRRLAMLAFGVAVVVAAAFGAHGLLDRLRSDGASPSAASDTNVSTAEIRDLSESFSASGTLQYEAPVSVAAPIAGTLLDIVTEGDELGNGDVIATIDDRVVVWLDGAVPAWRSLAQGDEGADVLQLETALSALGFNGDNDVTVDEEYTSATVAMVKDWQESLAVDPTGRVDLGTVVFGGGRTRVSSVTGVVGGKVSDGSALVAIGTTKRYATLDAAPSEAASLAVGDAAAIELPDRSVIDGTISALEAGSDSWSVTVAFPDGTAFPATDVVTVEMSWTKDVAQGAVTIPSSALLRRDNGDYFVEEVRADGTTTMTMVTIGASVGTRVQIVSGLSAGTQVISL